MQTTLATLFFLCLFSLTWAQTDLPLRGTINLEGETAIGAKIVVVGTERGTYTDIDGNFVITSPHPEGKLSISLLGAVSQIVDFSANNTAFVIDLLPQALSLEAIEIVGYRNGYRIVNPLCGPGRSCGSITTRLPSEELFMSDPAILNGRNDQLSISREEDRILPRFAQAHSSSQANLSFNGLPLDQKAAGLFIFLWESNPEQLIYRNPNDAIREQGTQSLGGNISFGNNLINPYDPSIQYQGLGGISFSKGESTLSHQEHHLRLKRAKPDQKLNLQGGLDYVSRPNYRSDSQWQLYAGNLQTNLKMPKLYWQTHLKAGSIQSAGVKSTTSVNQIALFSQKLGGQLNPQTQFSVDQLSQISHREDSLRQYHALRASVNYQPPNWTKIKLNAQYDFQQSEEQQVHAFTGGATYRLPKEMSLDVGVRQEQFIVQNENQASGATTIRASIDRNEDRCAPSRQSFRYETAVLFLNQNRVWLNSLTTSWEITENGSLWLEGRLHANRFAERQAVELCWLNWDGQGNQTQIGGSISLKARHQFSHPGFSLYASTSYSYNHSIIDPFDPTTAASSRSGSASGPPMAMLNDLPISKGIFSSVQMLEYDRWSLNLNTWAWLQNGANAGLANGLRLQEARLAWNAPAAQLHHKLKTIKCSLQGNNLLQWTDGNRQDFDQLAVRYAQENFNPIAASRQLLLGLEVAL